MLNCLCPFTSPDVHVYYAKPINNKNSCTTGYTVYVRKMAMGQKNQRLHLDKDLCAKLLVKTPSCICPMCSQPRRADLYKSSLVDAQQFH